MSRQMRVAILAIVAATLVAALDPAPAQAIDAGEIAIWSAVGVGVGIVIVLVATYLTRDEDQFFLVEPPPDARAPSDSRIHLLHDCRQPDGSAAVLCW